MAGNKVGGRLRRYAVGVGFFVLVAAAAGFIFLRYVDADDTRLRSFHFGEQQRVLTGQAAATAERLVFAEGPEKRTELRRELRDIADLIERRHDRLVDRTTNGGAGLSERTRRILFDERFDLDGRLRSFITALGALAAAPDEELTNSAPELAMVIAAAGPLAEAQRALVRSLGRDRAGDRRNLLLLPGGALVLILSLLAIGGVVFRPARRAADAPPTAISDTPGDTRDRFVEAIESMHDGVALFGADDRLVLCNQSFRDMFDKAGVDATRGASFEEMIGAAAAAGLIADIAGREADWVRERMDHHRKTESQLKQYLADGRCLQITEYRTREGGSISIQTDITELERREAARRVGEEKAASIISTVIDGIITFDAEGGIETFNRAAETFFGYDADDVIGRDFSMLLYEPFAAEYKEAVVRFLETDEPGALGEIREIIGRRRDGAEFPLEIAVNELKGTWTLYERRRAQRRVFIATLRDISQRKALAQQLQQSQKIEAIGTLAGGIAHDFNNILSIILGYASLARDDLAAPPPGKRPDEGEIRESLEMVIQAGRRARDLVEQILTFSRHTDQARRSLVLQPIVKEVLKLMRSTLPSTIEIRQRLESQPAKVMADPSQMHQVLMNLCTNAAHAMDESGGVMEILLDRTEIGRATSIDGGLEPGAYARLTVRDNGTGMDEATKERIFEPFFTTKEVGRGTGLGLSVVHGIITDHGGAISVESAAGKGTVFEALLPSYEGDVTHLSTADTAADATGKGRILFVDDEVALVRMAEKALTKLGYAVVGETRSLSALDLFRQDPDAFDLIVTDQTMPGLTGDALVGEVRKLRDDIPIVLCTGFNHKLTPEKAKEMGLDGYLMKPVMADQLGREVSRALEARGLSK